MIRNDNGVRAQALTDDHQNNPQADDETADDDSPSQRFLCSQKEATD
jgi:hypothetical protein